MLIIPGGQQLLTCLARRSTPYPLMVIIFYSVSGQYKTCCMDRPISAEFQTNWWSLWVFWLLTIMSKSYSLLGAYERYFILSRTLYAIALHLLHVNKPRLSVCASSTLVCCKSLPIPDMAWKVASVDFIESLPLSLSLWILVVVDKESSMLNFLQVAKLYTMENVHRLHGNAFRYSFRDKIFTSLLWTELYLPCLELICARAQLLTLKSDGQCKLRKLISALKLIHSLGTIHW